MLNRRSFFALFVRNTSLTAGIMLFLSTCKDDENAAVATETSDDDEQVVTEASNGDEEAVTETSVVDCQANGTSVSIGSNHGHTLTVSTADVAAGTEKTYSIEGSGGHDHVVTITAAQFSTLQSNEGIQVTSSTSSSHMHTITVNCV